MHGNYIISLNEPMIQLHASDPQTMIYCTIKHRTGLIFSILIYNCPFHLHGKTSHQLPYVSIIVYVSSYVITRYIILAINDVI